MNREDLLKRLLKATYDGAIKSSFRALYTPHDEQDMPDYRELGDWLKGLPQESQDKVVQVADMCAMQTFYNLLLVLDGLKTIEANQGEARLVLKYVKDGSELELNNPEDLFLTDVYKQMDI